MGGEDVAFKQELRTIAKENRICIKNKELKEKVITEKVLNNVKVKNSKNILIYVSMKYEVSTINLIKELFNLNKNIYVPKVIDNYLKFYQINSLEELEISKYGILEPTSNREFKYNKDSICIVPGLMFDKNNNRLGYGGGYYDRFLNKYDIYKIGICFKEFLIDKLEIEEHDIKMDLVIID